jgi:hypothetical protein
MNTYHNLCIKNKENSIFSFKNVCAYCKVSLLRKKT